MGTSPSMCGAPASASASNFESVLHGTGNGSTTASADTAALPRSPQNTGAGDVTAPAAAVASWSGAASGERPAAGGMINRRPSETGAAQAAARSRGDGAGAGSPAATAAKMVSLPPLGDKKSAVPAKSAPSAGGGLASRRNIQGSLKVLTQKKDSSGVSGHRKIMWCANLSDRYEFGQQVMPSCHKGMQVLFGKSRSTGEDVVIKVRAKKASFKGNEEAEWRLNTEFMLNLPHSVNICQLYEVLENVDAYYVVMEKCSGQDLFESLHTDNKMTTEESKEVLWQILTALADLHSEGLVHKDLKLENVMIDRTPSTSKSMARAWSESGPLSPVAVKIVDFDTVEEHQPMTPKRAKDVLGTDQYIAQEAYAGNYSPASDIFAVGVIAYRLLVGRFPFDSKMFNDKPGENWVGSPKMKEIREKICRYKVNYEHAVFKREPRACDLVQSMLAVRETDRPTAKEALAHTWFAGCNKRNTPSSQAATGVANGPAELPHYVADNANGS